MGKKRNLKNWLVMAVVFLLFGFAHEKTAFSCERTIIF